MILPGITVEEYSSTCAITEYYMWCYAHEFIRRPDKGVLAALCAGLRMLDILYHTMHLIY